MKTRADADLAAEWRYRAYQRRWRSGRRFDDDKTEALCEAYLRRMRVLARPRVAAAGNMHDLVAWVPRLGNA